MDRKKKTYTARVECTVIKTVTCQAFNEEDVYADLWDVATDEFESDQIDWKVLSVREDD